jgi:O-antigen ligase
VARSQDEILDNPSIKLTAAAQLDRCCVRLKTPPFSMTSLSSEPVLHSTRSRLWQAAIALFLLNAFLLISRILDLLGANSFKIPAVLLSLLGISLLATRHVFILWKTPAGKLLPIFVAWVLLTWLLAPHAPQSWQLMKSVLEGALLFAAASLLTTAADFRNLFRTLAGAGLIAAALGMVWSAQSYGRLALRGGPYADPNYYAMSLLAVIPIVWTVVAGKSLRVRLVGLLAIALPLVMLIRTGSRASFVSVGAMLVVLFFLSSIGGRVVLASLAAVAFVVLVAFVPNALKGRLGGAPTQRSGADDNSATARETLLVASLALTLNSPIFGLGPGNFADSLVAEGRSKGMDWAPLGTHNAYTQISSETGIPGILLFLLLIGFSFKNVISLLRQTAPKGATPNAELYQLARGLLLSLTGTCAFIFFLGEAYNALIYFWLGLTAGLRLLLAPPELEDQSGEIEEAPAPRP